jgi:hypothetical protein
MLNWQTLALKVVLWVGVAIVAVGLGFRLGYVWDHRAFVAYQATVDAQAAVAREQRAEQAREDAKTTQEVQDEAAKNMVAANAHIATLLSQLRNATAGNLPAKPGTTGAGGPDGQPDGHGPANIDRSLASAQGGTCQQQLDADDDALIDALTAEQLWRQYARGTGQAK